uniref:Uncharacterized protein n=1 Tax=Micrurus spixii TaxID=129469 RepID=A0A2D4LCF9_9SAUR
MDYSEEDTRNALTLLINWFNGKLQEERKNEREKTIIKKKRKYVRIPVKEILKGKQNARGKKKGGFWVTRKEGKPNNKKGEEREKRQGEKRGEANKKRRDTRNGCSGGDC